MKQVVVVEGDHEAWLLLQDMLVSIGYDPGLLQRYQSLTELTGIRNDDAEVVIADLTMPGMPGGRAFEKISKCFPRAPIIVIAENSEVNTATNTIRLGAQDYLIKGEIDKKILKKSIQYAIERKRIDNDYKQLFRDNPTPMFIIDKDSLQFLAVNDASLYQYGYTTNEMLQLTALDIRPDSGALSFREHASSVRPLYHNAGIWEHKKKDGTVFFVNIHAHEIDFNGKPARMVVAIDIDKAVQAELELKKKVRKVEHILESMTDAFFTVNNAHQFTYVNKEFEKVLQRQPEELLGKNIWEAFPEAIGLKFYEEYHKAINDRINVFFEEFLPKANIWLSVKAYPLESGLAVYFIDITEQKNAREKILQEERNLRAIINNTDDMIWSTDREYKILSANEAFWQHIQMITGKYKDTLNESDFGRETFSQWTGYFDRAFAGESYKIVWEEEWDGITRYAEVSFNPIRDDKGKVTGISCFSRDITTEKKMQEKIIADDLNMKALINNTEDLIWSIDSSMNMITANQSYLNTVQALSGRVPLPGEAIIDERFGETLVKEWRNYYSRGLSGEQFTVEHETNLDGNTRYSETRFNPILDHLQKVIGVSCFTRDITAPRKYLKRIERQNKELREIAWLQSHKVRYHVATILGLTDLINYNDEPLDSANQEVLHGIRKSSEDLDSIIREINAKTNLIDE